MSPDDACKKVVVVAGTSSGVGKTCLAVGLMAALRRKGLTVQPFKVGPDFLDPMHHEAATGRDSLNLDGWMLSQTQTLSSFHRNTRGCDIAVVEGVMGLYDSRDGKSEDGSTAQIAKWLGASVLLVLDCWALARSAAALVKGFCEFDQQLQIGGLLLNKVGSMAHTQWLQEAMASTGVTAKVLGGIPKDDSVKIPERHLGLHMPCDEDVPNDFVTRLAELVEAHVDLDAVLDIADKAQIPEQPECSEPEPGPSPTGPRVRIGVARDAAFCFYYHENLRLLEAAGAELVPFSPMEDDFPARLSGVYLGGGYPERHCDALAGNKGLRAALLAFACAGGVVYGECGGLLYLTQSLQALNDLPSSMVGVFPFRTAMTASSMKMGYVEVVTQPSCTLFPPNCTVRGHVFHFSEILQERVVGGFGVRDSLGGIGSQAQGWEAGYLATLQTPGAEAVREGYQLQRVLASYVHLHFGSHPALATSLVEACRQVDVDQVNAAAATAAADTIMTRARSMFTRGSSRGSFAASASVPDLALMGAVLQRTQSAEPEQLSAEASALKSPSSGAALQNGRERRASHSPDDAGRRHAHAGPLQHASDSASSGFFAGHWKSPPPKLLAKPRRSFSADRLSHAYGRQDPLESALQSPESVSEDELGPHVLQNGHSHAHHSQGHAHHPFRHQQTYSEAVSSSLYQPSPAGSYQNSAAAGRPPARPHAAASSSRPGSGEELVKQSSWEARRQSGALAGPSGHAHPHNIEHDQHASRQNGRNGYAHGSSRGNGIVSLLPSGTEILCALGLGHRLRGVTDLCDWPPEVAPVPKMSHSRIASGLTSAQVEACMQALKERGQPAFELDWQALARKRPSLVLTQNVCSACDPDAGEAAKALDMAGLLGEGSPTQALVLAPHSVGDVLDSILQVGCAAGVEPTALGLVRSLRARLRRIGGLVAGRRQPRVLSLEGLDPLCLGGEWLPELKQLAGGADDWQMPGDRPQRITWEQVREYAPEVLVLAPCGHSVAATRAESCDLAGLPGWWSLPAVKAGAVYIVDSSLLCRPGPRLVDGVELLAHILHPLAVPPSAAAKGVLKLALSGGQRCRQRLLCNYFMPLQ